MSDTIEIRPFAEADAQDCYDIRSEAFLGEFYAEQDPAVIMAGINAYMPSDYVRLGETAHIRVATDDGRVIGFYVLKILDEATAELMLLYIRGGYKGKGIGSRLINDMESWLAEHHPGISRIVLDTIVPGYNGKFYEKMGFAEDGSGELHYPELSVRTVRMAKQLHS